MKIKLMITVILMNVSWACFGQNESEQDASEFETKCKQIVVIWLNNESIVSAGVYSDTTNIEFPLNITSEQGKHFVRWEQTSDFNLDFIPDSIEKVVYKTVFADNAYHNYTINHYKEKIQDTISHDSFIDNYELVSSERKQGAWGTLTSVVANNYNGYITPIVNQQIISENDSTEVNIYYNRETYTLTWNTNGGIITTNFAYGTQKYGSKIIIPQLVRPGYSYKWDQTIPETLTDNSIFTAVWTVNSYEVKWMMNNCSDSVFDITLTDYKTVIKKPNDVPYYIGHEFKGWGLAATSIEVLTDFGEMTATDTINKSFYAIWEPNTYEVLWLYNDGSDRIFQIDSIRYDSVINAPKTKPTRAGYTFLGWGQQFNSDSTITEFGRLTNLEEYKYYALWEPYDSIVPARKPVLPKSQPKLPELYSQPTHPKNDKAIINITTGTSVTPNPTNGKAYYQNPNMKPGDVISIYDNNGKTIIKQTVTDMSIEEIDLQDQPQGFYFIELNGEQLKIIKL